MIADSLANLGWETGTPRPKRGQARLPGRHLLLHAHLESFAEGLFEGAPVKLGDVIGFVGTSGNAEGGPTHLHFDIHPNGGPVVPPVPYLDAWLAKALSAAQAIGGWNGLATLSLPAPARSAITAVKVKPVSGRPIAARAVAAASVNRESVHPSLLGLVGLGLCCLWWTTARRRVRSAAGPSRAPAKGSRDILERL